jgi:hypothetical protein
MAVYTCHHCHKALCSKHSYWIPDEQFPVFRQGKENRGVVADPKKMKLGSIFVGLAILSFAAGTGLLVLGMFLFRSLVTGLVLIIVGSAVIGGGIPLMILGNKFKTATILSTTQFPRYTRTVMTKFDVQIPVFYEHLGYFVAVHCWHCLREHHILYYVTAKDVLAQIHDLARQWQFPEHKEAPTDDELTKVGVWAANYFLQSFKFNPTAGMPITAPWPLRAMIRPSEISQRADIVATPAWYFDNRSAGHGFMEQEAFIKQVEDRAREAFGLK